jgi:GWxTD domain-containing protein
MRSTRFCISCRVGLLGAVLLTAACGGFSRLPLDPESRDFFETARLVMTSAEQEIFRNLPDEASRREFIADFWEKRDPDPDTAENEFKDEFERRVDYANKHFNEGRRGINTDRGRVYLYLGPPEKTDTYSSATAGFTIYWIYYTYDLGIEFVESRSGGEYAINQIMGNLMDAFETAKLTGFGKPRGGPQRLVSFDARYDGARKEITVEIPVKKLNFKEESGVLKLEFDFTIYIYKNAGGQKDKFEERRAFEGRAAEVENSKVVTFVFPYELAPGRNYVDVIVNGGQDNGKVRKIFLFKR